MGIKSWEFEVLQFADKKTKNLVRQLFDILDDNQKLKIHDKFFIIEYEFAQMAAKFKFDG